MSDYSKLVEALRSASTVSTAWEKLMHDAAAAIEDLQAEVKRLNMRCADCEYAASEWPEDPEHTKTPKRGEIVRCRECRWGHLCVMGQHLGLDGFCSKGEREDA